MQLRGNFEKGKNQNLLRDEDIQRIMGAVIPEIPKKAEEDAGEAWLKETYPDGYLDLDLGYIIPGCILTMEKRVEEEARCV